jgi:uncharacterized protein (TIGR00725 family)
MKTIIAVIGAGTCTAAEAALAEAVGRGLAQRGAILVCGGRGGVMEAACRGAQTAGGLTVGLLPGKNATEANPNVGVPLATGLGQMRNTLVVRAAQAVIAVGGEFGTLSEIGFALKLGIPVIGLGTWELYKAGAPVQAIRVAHTPEEAVAWALGEARD